MRARARAHTHTHAHTCTHPHPQSMSEAQTCLSERDTQEAQRAERLWLTGGHLLSALVIDTDPGRWFRGG